jgi:hypothetical protein
VAPKRHVTEDRSVASIDVRTLTPADTTAIPQAFGALGWPGKTTGLYERYLADQAAGDRVVFVAVCTPTTPLPDGASPDGASPGGAPRDGAPRDGASRDGAPRDGASGGAALDDVAPGDPAPGGGGRGFSRDATLLEARAYLRD